MYEAVIVIVLLGVVSGYIIWYAPLDPLLKYLLLLALAVGDLIAVVKTLLGGRGK